jgi:hypothetical protein
MQSGGAGSSVYERENAKVLMLAAAAAAGVRASPPLPVAVTGSNEAIAFTAAIAAASGDVVASATNSTAVAGPLSIGGGGLRAFSGPVGRDDDAAIATSSGAVEAVRILQGRIDDLTLRCMDQDDVIHRLFASTSGRGGVGGAVADALLRASASSAASAAASASATDDVPGAAAADGRDRGRGKLERLHERAHDSRAPGRRTDDHHRGRLASGVTERDVADLLALTASTSSTAFAATTRSIVPVVDKESPPHRRPAPAEAMVAVAASPVQAARIIQLKGGMRPTTASAAGSFTAKSNDRRAQHPHDRDRPVVGTAMSGADHRRPPTPEVRLPVSASEYARLAAVAAVFDREALARRELAHAEVRGRRRLEDWFADDLNGMIRFPEPSLRPR